MQKPSYPVFQQLSPVNPNAVDPFIVNPTGVVYGVPFGGDGHIAQVQWDGDLAGALELWVSNAEQPNQANDDDWFFDTKFNETTGTIGPAGFPGNYVDESHYQLVRWRRFKYTHSSGTGRLYGTVTPR